jgi:hypothetical protein
MDCGAENVSMKGEVQHALIDSSTLSFEWNNNNNSIIVD